MAGNIKMRQALIAKIHIAKNQLAMDDDTYRAVLMRITRKTSCKDCTNFQLAGVVREMERLGFGDKRPQWQLPPASSDCEKMMKKVQALLISNGWDFNYANAIAFRMYKKKRVQWLDSQQLHCVIAALQKAADKKAVSE